MRFYKNLSIHIKMFLIILGLSLGMAGFMITMFISNILSQNKQLNQLFTNIVTHSNVISAAVLVKDTQTIGDEIKILKMNQHINKVQVFYFDGKKFTDYLHQSDSKITIAPTMQKHSTIGFFSKIIDDHFELMYPIFDHDKTIGAIHINVVNLNNTITHLIQLIILITLIGIFIGAYSESIITKQLDSLVYAMRQVTQKNDYSVRVKKEHHDEIGVLVDSFNSMLSGIQNSEKLQRSSQAQIRRLAFYDVLTGLPNRDLFRKLLHQEISNAREDHKKIAIICLNLDNLNLIHDMYGHEVHDTLLKQITNEIRPIISKSQVLDNKTSDEFLSLGRLKGSELVITLQNEVNNNKIRQFVNNLIAHVNQPRKIGPHEMTITLSIGIAVFPSQGENAEALLQNASTAMHHVKLNDKNRFAFYNDTMNVIITNKIRIENELRKAIEKNELLLHFQPKFSLHNNKIVGMEALLRWQHSNDGLIMPDEFIPIAEESGLIIEIGDWVLNQACIECKALQSAGMKDLYVSVNVSGRQFEDPGLVDKISEALNRSHLKGKYLDLELTESIIMMNDEKTINTLHSIRALGVRISIDDFGTGYSSLRYLAEYPINTVKIDKSFITYLEENTNNAIIVKIIISLAHYLNLSVVAEGVETSYQLDYLKKHNCDEIQGYLISKGLLGKDFFNLDQKIRKLYHAK